MPVPRPPSVTLVMRCPECLKMFSRRIGFLAPESWNGVRQRLVSHRRKVHKALSTMRYPVLHPKHVPENLGLEMDNESAATIAGKLSAASGVFRVPVIRKKGS